MNDSQQDKNEHHLLQSLVLIILETILTFILKHDRVARIHAKSFIRNRTIITVNTFLPSAVFYISFDPKGLLFDFQKPENISESHLVISASSIDLMRVFLTGNEGSLRRIRLIGNEHIHDEFRLFLRSISLPMILADWKNWLTARNNIDIPKKSLEPLLHQIEQQRSQINDLTIKTKEYQYDLKILQRKHNFLSRIYIFIIFILSILIAYILWLN